MSERLCETERGMLGNKMKDKNLAEMIIFLLLLRSVCLSSHCHLSIWLQNAQHCCRETRLLFSPSSHQTSSSSVPRKTNILHTFSFLTAEDPVSASGPIRNVRSIVDLIFTGDGSAFSVVVQIITGPLELPLRNSLPNWWSNSKQCEHNESCRIAIDWSRIDFSPRVLCFQNYFKYKSVDNTVHPVKQQTNRHSSNKTPLNKSSFLGLDWILSEYSLNTTLHVLSWEYKWQMPGCFREQRFRVGDCNRQLHEKS